MSGFEATQHPNPHVAQIERALAQVLALDQLKDAIEVRYHLCDRRLERHLLVDHEALHVGDEDRILQIRQVGVEDPRVARGNLAFELGLQIVELLSRPFEGLAEAVQLLVHMPLREALAGDAPELIVADERGSDGDARTNGGALEHWAAGLCGAKGPGATAAKPKHPGSAPRREALRRRLATLEAQSCMPLIPFRATTAPPLRRAPSAAASPLADRRPPPRERPHFSVGLALDPRRRRIVGIAHRGLGRPAGEARRRGAGDPGPRMVGIGLGFGAGPTDRPRRDLPRIRRGAHAARPRLSLRLHPLGDRVGGLGAESWGSRDSLSGHLPRALREPRGGGAGERPPRGAPIRGIAWGWSSSTVSPAPSPSIHRSSRGIS